MKISKKKKNNKQTNHESQGIITNLHIVEEH